MFVMSDNPEFSTEAKGKLPGDAGDEFSFNATFVALSKTEQNRFDLNTEEGTEDFLKRTLVGIDGVLDTAGAAVAFTDTTRDWLIDRAHTRSALVRAYFGAVYTSALGN